MTPSLLLSQPQKCAMGIYSRMMDMGGAPTAGSDRTLIRTKDASKNSKLQAVAFDFEILTRSLEDAKHNEEISAAAKLDESSAKKLPSASSVTPDLGRIAELASLLKVEVDIGKTKAPAKKTTKAATSTPPGSDVRAKYAAKLKGGLAGVELAKSQVEDTLKGGDAAGHLAARELAIKSTAASPTKWMALTGTGKLLSYLTHRSIRIALLPNTRLNNDQARQDNEFKYMTDFSKQLKEIVVDAVVPFDGTKGLAAMIRKGIIDEFEIHPNKILLVSDKDEYLQAAKDLGMITCRLRPKNARRGNITAHYNAEDVPSVQEVVNEISGISFNAVLNR